MTTNNVRPAQITFSALDRFLDSGATLDQINTMIDMLKEQKETIETNINDWMDLIPAVPEDETATYNVQDCGYHWGDQNRRRNLKVIVFFLCKKGYVIRFPRLAQDGDGASWEALKGGRINRLEYSADAGYTLNGNALKLEGMR